MALLSKKIFQPFLIYFLLTGYAIAQSPTTPLEIKTDAVARKAIGFLNISQADSVYALTGEAFRQQVTLAQWQQGFQKQFVNLLPLKNLSFKSSYNGISSYKVEGTIPLTLNISIDVFNKIENFSFVSYQEEAQSAPMNQAEKQTDELAIKLLDYLNTRQADKIYAFAGNKFRNFMDSATFKNAVEKQLYPLTPLPRPVFIRSIKGVNKYKLGALQYLVSTDQYGKFETWGIQPYVDDAQKTQKAATDNLMQTKLDSLVNRWLSAYIQTKANVGVSAAVYYNGTDHFYNYGETVKDNRQLPNAHTLYEIGSITKTFTATLLAKAVNEGLVSLNDPITRFLPDSVAANPDLKSISLKQLSNHTSGLPRMPDSINATVTDLNQPYEHYDEAHMFAFLKKFKATRAAGTSYEYSNLAVGLLGVILEKIYHKPYPELVKQYITQPLQLHETKIVLSSLDVKHLAQGYDATGNPVAPWQQLSTKAAGAIKSTAYDMLQYGKSQLPTFNNSLSKAMLLTHQPTLDDGVFKVGLGWHYLYKDADPVIQHSGATGGYKAAVAVNLKRGLVVAVLTNNVTTGDALGLEMTAALENALPK